MADQQLADKIFEMVSSKVEAKGEGAKKKRQRKLMTPEQKANALENLKRGRAKSLATRRAKAAAKKQAGGGGATPQQ